MILIDYRINGWINVNPTRGVIQPPNSEMKMESRILTT